LHFVLTEAMDDILERVEPFLQLGRIDSWYSPINGGFNVIN
jgi:hypothetical protein